MNAENKVVAYIHPTAVIHPHAKIGKDVQIGAYAVIDENVEIGRGTKVMSHAYITGWTGIGEDCIIYPGAVIGSDPQDLKFKGEKSYVFIGNRTTVRECATVHRGCGAETETRIGDDCLLMAYTHVAHNCIVGNNVIMANSAMIAGHVVVEDRVVIGGITGVHQFVRIGRNAMIGGASKLVQDVVPYTIVDGHPAKVSGLNSVGISRAGISIDSRRNIKKAYKILYRSNLSLSQAIEVIEQDVDLCEEVEHFLRFLRNAERGICRSRKENMD
ncbi:acyl-ACP--UDP-N-acetylglucosamine O-acyltransferase [Pectinatus brassicae]|uniref:Acyl-[acyl-carrier-protein]--UDP-N-acetylglucosamine O-acyltransferase n=1 Tax=Pectinatus brassicae TaxID=862415 RepID=A0A840UQ92_9FIRM|nr:acyl-ACP--UDP-N-acetylglucosamine O-acyltransferase [Pectinatus brassicae]MBB5336352.1 UDP-N-acetylglucosamine acyltransferase [Pectinatus brassicae]